MLARRTDAGDRDFFSRRERHVDHALRLDYRSAGDRRPLDLDAPCAVLETVPPGLGFVAGSGVMDP